ncbi:MAG TPA: hypothetical protein VF056_07730 [Thermoleophilaceae bacterium]
MLTSRTRRLSLLTLVVAALSVAALTPAARADSQRYAIPGGPDTDCSAASPCSITKAVQGASAGDEVVLNSGDYDLSAALMDPAAITIRGVAGQPRPRLLLSGPEFVELQAGSALRWVEIDQTDPGALRATGATVDQVVVRAPNNPLFIDSSTVSNSIVVATGPAAIAIRSKSNGTSNSVLRNVTAIATGNGGAAVQAFGETPGNVFIGAINVIARGGPGGWSFRVGTDNVGGQASIGIGHSSYAAGTLDKSGTGATFTDGGGNIALAPTFVNPAAGDYRQAPGSPTIDAGLDDARNGALDLDGDPRAIGKTDIGADEFLAAPAGGTGAGGGTGPAGVGSDPAAPPSPVSTPFAGVRLVSTRLTTSGRFITVRLSCPAGTLGRCSGRTKLTARRSVLLGRAGFSIEPGKQARVRVRVSRAGRRLLRPGRRVRAKDTNAARDGAGQSKRTVTAVTIRRRR